MKFPKKVYAQKLLMSYVFCVFLSNWMHTLKKNIYCNYLWHCNLNLYLCFYNLIFKMVFWEWISTIYFLTHNCMKSWHCFHEKSCNNLRIFIYLCVLSSNLLAKNLLMYLTLENTKKCLYTKVTYSFWVFISTSVQYSMNIYYKKKKYTKKM